MTRRDAIGCNESVVHTDMMISNEDVDVTAETHGGESLTLRPEATAGIVRASITNGLLHNPLTVEVAARNRIAVNPHEPIKDTGLRRTYPNWISREGARGMEYNAWGQFANGPAHEATLVYTRMLSGPMDYTPGVLSLVGAEGVPHASTLAKQLGLYLAIYSPIQMAADFIETLAAHPKATALRCSGIYGPGRGALLRKARGDQPGARRWTNRIHADDAASAISHLLDLDAPPPATAWCWRRSPATAATPTSSASSSGSSRAA